MKVTFSILAARAAARLAGVAGMGMAGCRGMRRAGCSSRSAAQGVRGTACSLLWASIGGSFARSYNSRKATSSCAGGRGRRGSIRDERYHAHMRMIAFGDTECWTRVGVADCPRTYLAGSPKIAPRCAELRAACWEEVAILLKSTRYTPLPAPSSQPVVLSCGFPKIVGCAAAPVPSTQLAAPAPRSG
jgi:hypothetical protein